MTTTRRECLRTGALATGALLVGKALRAIHTDTTADYALHVQNAAVEIAPKRIIGVTPTMGNFPGRCCASGKASR